MRSEQTDALEPGLREPWVIVLAERDDDGEWRTVGEPVCDAVFNEMGLAHSYAEKWNKRDLGLKFDWLSNPPWAWLAVRAVALRCSLELSAMTGTSR